MNWVLTLSILIIVLSIAAMFYANAHRSPTWRQTVFGGFSMMNMGAVLLVGQLMSDGPITTLLQVFLMVIAGLFFVAEVRAGGPGSSRPSR